MLASKIVKYSNYVGLCAKRIKNIFCAIFGAIEFEKWNLYKNPQNEFIENLELVLICNSNSIWNLALLIKTKW